MNPNGDADRAWKIYLDRLQPILEPAERGRFVAIDVVTGEYFVGNSAGDAASKGRRTGARLFCLRIGYDSTYRIGVRWPARN